MSYDNMTDAEKARFDAVHSELSKMYCTPKTGHFFGP